jgi:hypothetical protein
MSDMGRGFPAGGSGGAMPPFKQKPQMTAAEFNAALRETGFGVDHGRIVDVSGACSGFTAVPIFPQRRGQPQRHAVEGYLGTLSRD